MTAVFSSKSLVGKVLQGNYLLERLVGKGGMAWVFRARHTKLQEVMAVKILLPHIAEDETVRRRFLDEGKIQFRLKHPNIVQVTDLLEDDNLIGIVLEWIDGDDLKALMKRVRAPMP
ncbi:MAG: protein kinase, partial [Myxococcota bacterium]